MMRVSRPPDRQRRPSFSHSAHLSCVHPPSPTDPTHTADPRVHSARCRPFAHSSESARHVEYLVSRLRGTLPGIVAARTPAAPNTLTTSIFSSVMRFTYRCLLPSYTRLPRREQGACATSSGASSLIERTD